MNKTAVLFIFLVFPFLAECASLKKLPEKKNSTYPVVNTLDEFMAALDQHPLKYNWLATQAEVSFDDGSNNVTANLNLKNRKDSILWASANLLIEAFRALVNKDSAIILDRLNKQYTVSTVSHLNQLFGINNLSLNGVQNLLQGSAPFGLNQKAKFSRSDSTYTLETQYDTYKENITYQASILRMKEYRYERNATEYVVIRYSDYHPAGNEFLPNKIDIEVHSPEKIHIILNVSDYSLEDNDDAPFNIPASYKKVN